MKTTNVLRTTFSLCASPTLLLGFACVVMPAFAATPATVTPASSVNINEAPPPWQGQVAPATAQPDAPQAQPVMAVPTVEQGAASGSSVENWYRNRRKAAENPGNEESQLQAAAQSGDAKAQYKLAMLYRKDDRSPDNIKQSLVWQQKAAQAGHVEAQYGLGLLYSNGQYVAADNQQAHEWFQKAANQGHVAARLALLSLRNGASAQAVVSAPAINEAPNLKDAATAVPPPVVAQSFASAPPALKPKASIPVVDPASRREPVTTKVSLSEPEVDPVPEQVVDVADNDTDNRDAGASSSLDLTGVEPAVLRQSAEEGDKQAQLMLGTMYEDGLGGLPSDLREAAHWYEQAAKQGYPKAQYNLGLLYEDGRGVNQNYNQAAFWYDKAAKAGFTEAQNNLGVLYVLGNGVKKDSKKAEALFSEAASRGNADAERNINMLRKG